MSSEKETAAAADVSSAVTDPVVVLKNSGNSEYAKANYATAMESFNTAISIMKERLKGLDEAALALISNSESSVQSTESREESAKEREKAVEERNSAKELAATLFCNRSMCHSALSNWSSCVDDSRMAIQLNAKYEKAYFRLVKAYLELHRFKEARLYLVIAFNSCPDSKFLKSLDTELTAATGVPSRPKPTDFDIIEELGDGNFSKIFKAEYKPTKKMYAIKTIEKQTVDRMKRRHKNIHNEILMEKRVLNKLSHPNIVHLFATFQDYGTLYYQMELMAGEVWTMIQDDVGGSYEKVNRGNSSSVGCYYSLARFYLAECLDALEYMHSNGITHRDIKPENMMITASGHLKLVDFGTCKDLRSTDLNGQEFVGTAEFMAPEVVDSENSGPAADLWSLGVVLHQLVTGHTPFKAPSPYLSFLRIKRAFLRLPTNLPHADDICSVLRALLQRDPAKRLSSASDTLYDPVDTANFSYDKLRKMSLFQGIQTLSQGTGTGTGTGMQWENRDEGGVAAIAAVRVPTLREMAVRAVANAGLMAAESLSANGGARNDKVPKWVQRFKLYPSPDPTPSPRRLAPTDRASIIQYLRNKAELHSPSVYKLFFPSVIDPRTRRTDLVEREFYGNSRATQGQWSGGFSAVHFSSPLFGKNSLLNRTDNGGESEGISSDAENTRLRLVISAVNKLRPKFVVVTGNFTACSAAVEGPDTFTTLHKDFRKCMARVSETIPVLFVPGVKDVGVCPTPASLEQYHGLYGADYFGFWFGGVRVLVLNSPLFARPEGAPEESRQQCTWLLEELEQCKLCASQVVVFAYHSFTEQPEGAEEDRLPQEVREYWLPRFRNFKVKFMFSGSGRESTESRAFADSVVKKKKKAKRVEEVNEQGVALSDVDVDVNGLPCAEDEEETKRAARKARDNKQRGSELKPSEILALADDDDHSSSSSDDDDDDDDDEDAEDENNGDGPIFLKREKIVMADGEYEDSSPFSPDLKYSGPTAISTAPIAAVQGEKVMRVMEFEDEDTALQTSYPLDGLPTKLTSF